MKAGLLASLNREGSINYDLSRDPQAVLPNCPELKHGLSQDFDGDVE
jgi:hypothetical protein